MRSTAEKTSAQAYRDAVWASTLLTPEQRIVALCYADHAYGKDCAWVAQRRLMARTGIRSTVTATHAVESLVAAGWLERLGAPDGHRQRVVYRFGVPDEAGATASPTQTRPRDAHGRYVAQTAPSSGAVVSTVDRTTRGPKPHHAMDTDRTTPWSEPHHPVEQTAPLGGDDSRTYDSQREYVRENPPAGAAAPSAAPPGEQINGADARAAARAIASQYPAANTSHWKAGTAPQGDPNPRYDPAATAAQLAADEHTDGTAQ